MDLTGNIYIYSASEEVFNVLNRPYRWPEWSNSIKNVKGSFEDVPIVGEYWQWSYKLGPMNFNGMSRLIECVPNRRLVIRSNGYSLDTTWIWVCEEINAHITKLTVNVSLSAMKNTFLSRTMLNPFQKELLDSLDNLKLMMEAKRLR